jgi:hypothetical protein
MNSRQGIVNKKQEAISKIILPVLSYGLGYFIAFEITATAYAISSEVT